MKIFIYPYSRGVYFTWGSEQREWALELRLDLRSFVEWP